MKDTFYFTHDYNTRSDASIKRLLAKHGMAGYGIFWAIIEDLYNNANALRTDYDCIAYDLRVESDTIKSIINDFNLFEVDNDIFSSKSVERRLSERNAKREKAKESASYRWGKSERNANAMRTQCDSNAIKERKGKEKKGKEIINNIGDFDFFILEKNTQWVESTYQMITNAGAKIEYSTFTQLLNTFCTEKSLTDAKPKNEQDYRQHFINWVKIQVVKPEYSRKSKMVY